MTTDRPHPQGAVPGPAPARRARGTERAEWTRIALDPAACPLDLMTARFDRLRYAPHTHEEFAVGVTTHGLESIRYRGASHVSGPGDIVVLEPGEPHTGEPAAEEGFGYRVFYPWPELLAEQVCGRPYFRDPVIHDPELAAALLRAHRAAAAPGADPLRAESELPTLLGALALRHAGPGSARPRTGLPCGTGTARAVMDRLAAAPATPPTLAEIATGLGLSRYQVVRAFREAVGMPPYAWLAQHRVARARALLDAGHRPAEAAARVGFADQAHLTRWFRRVLGVTPGAYRNSVQDPRTRPGRD
ncbi:helix-turn-helix transcriptional regulator [Streptomyces hoynatensis]|uniref:AraC family transcriptional regulator n=1 Tax=Streptomyces hoynatensis TaxID=1141874 RepID=A0A3A9ZC48_9ACTN|nr:AraC family transcriptional regulator [Streptomyces hoynatensis]RKN45860.1 AraC family transcriptional regulator [Streptomyces hoynatensis]